MKGQKYKANFNGRGSLKETKLGITIFDNDITIDEYRRRISYPLNQKRSSQKHFLLLGCSYVFGTAVNNNETITWHMNSQQSDYEAYNNGFGSYGTGSVLWRMQTKDFTDGVKQTKGVAVYNFISSHLLRTIGSTANSPWAKWQIAFRETSPYNFIALGNFAEAYPFKTAFYEWLAHTNTLRFFKVHLPVLTKEDHRLAVRMIQQIQKLYLEQTDSSNLFVVALYPQTMDGMDLDFFRKSLSKEKIYFIDYSKNNIQDFFDHNIRIPYDGHPNGEAHKLYAQVLLNDIDHFFKFKK
ncbi:MAG: hypothetical protein IT287_03175 [Bdellovibrionaceae bacterium]|nr:hypothetical protein [Pseudobdellovibrionaceae bacterium]